MKGVFIREKLLFYALKYQGNYFKIKKAIDTEEEIGILSCDSNYLTILDKTYPKVLLSLEQPPYVLFYHGDIKLIDMVCVGVIGSRQSVDYAIRYTKLLTKALSNNFVIVSGIATGIDGVAHSEALLNKGKTIGVLGSGINYIYPKVNDTLYSEIKRSGLIISEYPNDTKPQRYYFVARNRIIAALSKKLFVMQAKLKSGTLSTVDFALEMNKEIYVLPYQIDDRNGLGCLKLIDSGASMIDDELIKLFDK